MTNIPFDAAELPIRAEVASDFGPAVGPILERALEQQKVENFPAAEASYRRFLKTHPTHLLALNNAALVAKKLGRMDVAVLRLSKAVRHHPNAAEAHFNLANTLQEIGRLEESIAPYRRAIALRPNYVKAHQNLGNALDKLRRFDEAADSYRRALAYGGDNPEILSNLGLCLKQQGQMLDAIVHLVAAVELEPDRADLHFGIGSFYFETHNNLGAVAHFRRVLELEPEHNGARSALLFQAQRVCDWAEVSALAPAVRAATDRALANGELCLEGALENLSRDSDPQRNQAVAMSTAHPVVVNTIPLARQSRRGKTATEKIRIGYLSADFREHPVAQMMCAVFGRHDRNRFTVSAYSYGAVDGSPWRKRIEAEADRFVDFRVTADDLAARRIYDDGIDILVDLTLWTFGNRPRICASRPASVQVQYLGFPGTSGAPYYDYAIVDPIVVPAETRPYWNERLVYMPDTYFVVNRDQPIDASGLGRADFGLPADSIVFCSFNQSYKIDPTAFGAWMRILGAVPGSVLWLPTEEPVMESNLRREAEARGIAADRLVFAAKVPEKSQHLERLRLADVALDTLNYNGHTTTVDALWAGIPVVATLGRHFASRASASLLRAAGLGRLVAADLEGYERMAIELARQPGERARIRQHLAEARQSAPLFDTDRTVTNLETAYERIWALHRGGVPFEDIRL